MIITKTPFRISLFGGGTDHPVWFKNHGGEVISFTIDKFCYLTTRILPPFFEYKYRIVYSKIETVKSINEIAHPAVRESIRKFCPNLSLEIHHDGDLPARTGIGSSSAFAVGLIHSLLLLNGSSINNYDLANKAIDLEQNILLENVGSQDQIACAIGGMNYITFSGDKNWNVQKIVVNKNLEDAIMDRVVLIYTGIPRNSSDIQSHLIINLNKKLKVMNRSIELARECKKIIQNYGDLDVIGEMLAESWALKKEMNNKAVTKELDMVWGKAKAAGALGGKVLGAGGGGFCLFWVKSGKRKEFLKNFNFGLHVPINMSALGTQSILK
jgi:D-glycero-alpha-D-manno-heptose-7-phosphate kinase